MYSTSYYIPWLGLSLWATISCRDDWEIFVLANRRWAKNLEFCYYRTKGIILGKNHMSVPYCSLVWNSCSAKDHFMSLAASARKNKGRLSFWWNFPKELLTMPCFPLLDHYTFRAPLTTAYENFSYSHRS